MRSMSFGVILLAFDKSKFVLLCNCTYLCYTICNITLMMASTMEWWSIDNQKSIIIRSLKEELRSNYGFVPKLDVSIFLDTLLVIGNTISWYYLSRPNNLAFHELTKDKVVPNIVKQVLGLSRKFIRVEKHSVCADELE